MNPAQTSSITIDYHSHNLRCGHAQGVIEDYIKAAVRNGLVEIGISDHSPAWFMEGNDPLPAGAMAKDELDGYVQEVLGLKAKYQGQIAVKLGLEVDYIEDMEDFYREKLAPYPWDYLIGSVHIVGGTHVYEARRWNDKTSPMQSDPSTVFAEYYRLVAKSAQSGMFDILAHTSAVLAYAPRPFPAQTEMWQDAALEAIRDTGVAIEINTSGYRKMTTDPFPTARMVGVAASLGIPITFGSDSHRPEQVAYNRSDVERLLTLNNITELATFTARERLMLPLQTVMMV